MTKTIYLSSNPSSAQINYSSVYLSDISTLIVNISGVSLTKPPVNIKFDWGDNSKVEIFNNEFSNIENFNSVNEATYGYSYSIMREYSHVYSPSDTSLTKNLTCQALVTFYNGSSCRFVVPITIYSPSFYSRVEDLSLIQNNFTDNRGSILFTFQTQKDGYILESLYTPTDL